MRGLTFILSFIILGLSCLPCADKGDAALKGHEQSSVVTVSQADGDAPHADFCNPFCSCTCCGVQLSGVKFAILAADSPIRKLIHTDSYNPPSPILLPAVIWQPPQLRA